MRRAALVVVVLSLLAGGCGRSASIGLHLEPGEDAVVEIHGQRAVVSILNRGPATVTCRVEAQELGGDFSERVPGGGAMPAFHGPATVFLENDEADRAAAVRVQVEGMTGISVDGGR